MLGRHLCPKYVANGLDYLMHTRDIGRERPKALPVGKKEKDLLQNQTSAITHISILMCVWGGGGGDICASHLCIHCYLLSFFLDVYLVHKWAP